MKANMKCSHYEYRDSDLVWTYLNSSLFNICIVQIILVKISTSDICVFKIKIIFYFKLIWNYNHGSYYTIKSLVLNELQDEINERILTQCVCYIWKAKKVILKVNQYPQYVALLNFRLSTDYTKVIKQWTFKKY